MPDQEASQMAENQHQQNPALVSVTSCIEALSLEEPSNPQIEAHKILTNFLESQESEIPDALYRHSKERGELFASYRDTVLSNEKRCAKDPLTDEQQENVSVWIRQTPEEVNPAGDVKREEMVQRFQSYNSHHYLDERGVLGSQTGKMKSGGFWILRSFLKTIHDISVLLPNDHEKSLSRQSNHRPPHRRILYHQGYRAGILNLNIPFTDLDLTHPHRYSLVAMSRDEFSRIAPPDEGEEAYHALGPVKLQYLIGFKKYYGLEADEFVEQVVPAVNEDCGEPHAGPWSENGYPHWDTQRFGITGGLYPVYNVLLVEKIGGVDDARDSVRRVGVGKMFFGALRHAGAEVQTIDLR